MRLLRIGRRLRAVESLLMCPLCDVGLRDAEWDRHVLDCMVLSVGLLDGVVARTRDMGDSEAEQYEKLREQMLHQRKLDGWRNRFGPYTGSREDLGGSDPLGPPWDDGSGRDRSLPPKWGFPPDGSGSPG